MTYTKEKLEKMAEENGGSLDLRHTQITALPDNLTVGDSLYLSGTQITALPEGLTIGGSLDLSGTQITALPDNLTVGGSLYLGYTQITALPDNLTVGGWLDLSGTQIKNRNSYKRLSDGDYVPGHYIYADGILTHIRGCHKVGDYTLYVGKIKGKNVVSDGKNFAHCDGLRDGIADLLFKSAADRGAEQYSNLTLDSIVTADEAITMYRIITGACRAGTKAFVDSLGEIKDAYTIREVIDITAGQYNSSALKSFFEDK